MTRVVRFALAMLLAMAFWLAAAGAAFACTSGGCVSVGPRLASISSTRAALLDAVFGRLTNSTLHLDIADWSTLAGADVSLAGTVGALQTTLNVSTPSAALGAQATLAQVLNAAAAAAQQENRTVLQGALGRLAAQLGVTGTLRLGDLIVNNGLLGTTRINALTLATGIVQLYNTRNVLSTPQPVSLLAGDIGLLGLASTVQLWAQVIEPPVFVCGGVNSSFRSAAMRVKLRVDLGALGDLPAGLLSALGIANAGVALTTLDLHVDIGRADGMIESIDAVSGALGLRATPGVADLYLGSISDTLFFDRSRALTPADLGYATIGWVRAVVTTVGVRAKAYARGQAPTTDHFSIAPGQSYSASTGAAFAANLLGGLIANLQLQVSPSLGVLDAVVLPALQTIIGNGLSSLLGTVLGATVEPVLEVLGIRLGEVVVTSGGAMLYCSVRGSVYRDADHNARQDGSEAGTGVALYAKLVASATPAGPAAAVTAVDAATGAYAFPNVLPAGYVVVIGTDASPAVVAPAVPAGWIATETPSLSRAFTLAATDVAGLRFGLYAGSRLQGSVFTDDGRGGGTPHNGVRDGAERARTDTVVRLIDAAGTTVLDAARTDAQGAYTLWIPASAVGALKVVQPADALLWVSVSGRAGTTGGAYALATDTVAFTPASGSTYTGVDFGDVAANRLEGDGLQTVAPGATVAYAHVLHAGSAGQLTLGATASPGLPGWSATLQLDPACNGQLDSGDVAAPASLSVVAGQMVCFVVKVQAAANAPEGARYPVAVTAQFAYAGTALTTTAQRLDLTTASAAQGLRLTKSVDRASALPGQELVYTLQFANVGTTPLNAVVLRDAVPAHTTFAAASCGALPSGLTCGITRQPTPGATGAVEWTLTGPLAPGAQGQALLRVFVQ